LARFRPGHNTDCRQEYLARGAQQQAAQREEREREKSEDRLLHNWTIARTNASSQLFQPERFVRLFAGGKQIGWLRPELAARLGAWKDVFQANSERVTLLKPAALAAVVEELASEGFIPGWRNERYRIEDLFEIERAAARPFGLKTHAVHVNGIAGGRMWLARRSATKPIDPGMLDNLVGGGIGAAHSVADTLVKEAWEEAGIPAELARKAKFGATASVLREVPEGVQSEIVHIYDLELPADFEPRNQDGEVSEFKLLSFAEVERETLTYEAAIVARDYISRARAP
jgi:8-oxo-dGTP pyrophosphatase MutT (NUDIX family)